MASVLSPRRTDSEVALQATVAQTERVVKTQGEGDLPGVTWLLAAVGGGLAAALTGWVLVSGLTVLAWLVGAPGSFSGAMAVGTQLWLLANGAGARLGTSVVTLVPYGATFLFAVLLSRFSAFAARQARRCRAASAARVGPGSFRGDLSIAATITGLATLAYAIPVVVTALLVGSPAVSWPALVGTSAVIALAAGGGSGQGLRYSITASWPAWCRAVPRAVLGAQLALGVTGAGALTAALLVHVDRVSALTASLHAGWVGGLTLWLAQVGFVPNAAVWAASYTLGAGFSLGQSSVVAPTSTELGIVPSVPLLGALPSPGVGDATQLWWLAAGVLAGCVAAWLVVRARPAARFDETGLVGGLAGLLAGLVFVALAWASGGDLGAARLRGLGPRLLPLMMLSTSTLGLAGMLFGCIFGLLRRPVQRRTRQAAASQQGEQTESSDDISKPAPPEAAASPPPPTSG